MIALSWSRLADYQQCPLKFRLKYIDKHPLFKEDMDKSPHLVRGSNVHKALENYVIQKTTPGMEVKITSLPEVEATKPFVDNFLNNYQTVIPETQIAINKDWKRVEWFAPDAYYRAILDLIAIRPTDIQIIDYKTGKFRDYDGGPTGKGQLHLSAAIGLSMWPEVNEIRTTYAYVDHRKTIPKVFTQADRIPLREHFDEMHNTVNSDKKFDPTVNEFCKWCAATKAMCPFSRKL